MAEQTQAQLQDQLKQNINANKGGVMGKKPEDTNVPPPAANEEVKTTSEFKDVAPAENTDPTMPVKKNGMVSRAEKPIRTETLVEDGETKTIGIYRVYEKDGTLAEIAYEMGTGTKLNKEGRQDIAAMNREARAKQEEALASLQQTSGTKLKMMDFLRKHSFNCGLITPNNNAPELTVVVERTQNAALDQKRNKSQIREKSPGGAKSYIICVPARAYDYMTSSNAFDAETVNEICSDPTPQLRLVPISKDDFPMTMLTVFGGPLRVMPELFDENTSNYASVKEIPSVNGMPAGVELIYYVLDTKKVGLNLPQPVQKAGETMESFAKRTKAWTEAQERAQRFRAGGLKLEERASVIRIRSNARSSMVSRKNHIPFRVFDTTPVGVVVAPQKAREMNSIYLKKLEADGVTMAASEAANVTANGGKIESSIYFPATPAEAGKIPTINTYFKKRDAEGKLVKIPYTPKHVILKELVKSEKGVERAINVAHTIGEPGYNSAQFDMIRTLFSQHVSRLPEAQRCSFITPEEIVAASKKARTSTASTKISSTSVDKSLLDANLMMLSLAVGDGSAVIEVNDTIQNIEAVKATRTVNVSTMKRLSPEKRAQLEASLKAKA